MLAALGLNLKQPLALREPARRDRRLAPAERAEAQRQDHECRLTRVSRVQMRRECALPRHDGVLEPADPPRRRRELFEIVRTERP
jgi:hypothetical protein